jgi:hypothetical protein
MPKLRCPCGFVHDLSPIPDDGWLTILTREFDAMIPDTKSASVDGVLLWRELLQRSGLLYECPKCGRIMWEKPGAKLFSIYRRED